MRDRRAARPRASRTRPSAFETTFWATTSTSVPETAIDAAPRAGINSREVIARRRPRDARRPRPASSRSGRVVHAATGAAARALDLPQHAPGARSRARAALERARRSSARSSPVSTSSASDGSRLDRVAQPAALRLLDVALAATRAELRLERARRDRAPARSFPCPWRSGTITTSSVRDAASRRSSSISAGRSAGSRRAPAARGRSRARTARARPASAALRLPLLARGRRSAVTSALRARSLTVGSPDTTTIAVEQAASCSSAPARRRTSRPRARRASRRRASRRGAAWPLEALDRQDCCGGTRREPYLYAESACANSSVSRGEPRARLPRRPSGVGLVQHHAGRAQAAGGGAPVRRPGRRSGRRSARRCRRR